MTQFRLSRVQVVNWGTFDGAWSFDVPWKGLLLTGPSGAGKSSLLDAMAAVLVRPARLRFNAAAQGTDTGDRDRTTLTYVRGAHKRETVEATGEVGTAFLRRGAAWSGIALSFVDETGARATLLRLFHIRSGSTEAADLKSMYIFAPDDVDLLALKPYVENGIENRRVKAQFPEWHVYGAESYTGFAARFRRHLGMGSEQAQVLLHKTQSAKNLTNLDSLFRDFMLDVPETFKLADETTEQFDELSQAHSTVVDARLQVERLLPLRGHAEVLDAVDEDRRKLASEETHLETWLASRSLTQVMARIEHQQAIADKLEAEVAAAEREVRTAEDVRQQAQRAVDGSGGAELQTLERLREAEKEKLAGIVGREQRLREAASMLGLPFPENGSEAVDFLADVVRAGEQAQEELERHRGAMRALMEEKFGAGGRLEKLDRELTALRRHGSNLDGKLLAVRRQLAEHLGVEESTLPFVGELIQVRSEDTGWTGAIERVLGGFARTLVVPEAHYLAAAELIDELFLGARLVYQKVAVSDVGDALPESGASLLAKLELADTPYRGWLGERLLARFDYACVESASDFSSHEKAVTRRGQVKHNTSLHEKDDRRRVDDRSRWVLGFTTEAKERELQRLIGEFSRDIEAIEQRLARLDEEEAEIRRRLEQVRAFDGFVWADVDQQPVRDDLARIDRDLEGLRAQHQELARLRADLERAAEAYDTATKRRNGLAVDHEKAERTLRELEERAEELRAVVARAEPVPAEVAGALAEQEEELGAPEAKLELRLRERFRERAETLQRRYSRARSATEKIMTSYQREWPGPSADWGDVVEYLPEYLVRLDSLESDGLPKFEDRFFSLLQNQARNNISQLSMQIRGARREISNRVGEVNKSLRMTEFAPGEYLQIEVNNRLLPDVTAFLNALNAITSGSVMDSVALATEEERREAEERFGQMRDLLQRLASPDPADRAWRQRCLDTRQHVQFRALVQDEEGHQVDVFTGSGGRSGGERQKLVTFCLAAALRFQLAPPGESRPTYGLVVIDEAFDKADHSFTQAGLEVFRTFGFQLLLATPMKMLQTIEDHVGGVVMVENLPGEGSRLHQLIFDSSRPEVPAGEEPGAEQDVLV